MEQTEYHDVITDKEEIALEKFKAELTKEIEVFPLPLISDNDKLIRFLRARKLDLKKSKIMLKNYLKWRIDNNVDNLYSNFNFPQREELLLLYTHNFHKTCKKGQPLIFQCIGDLKVDKLFEIATHEQMIQFSINLYERMERDMFPACSRTFKKYIHSMFGVMDFSKLSKKLLNKKVIKLIQAILTVCQDYYPECLGETYFINTGIIFRTLYTICKPFVDAKTRAKVKVFGKNYRQGLLEKIPAENLPFFYGGTCNCKPEGCFFSNAGPWKVKENEPVTPEIQRRRDEVIQNIIDRNMPKEGKKSDDKKNENKKNDKKPENEDEEDEGAEAGEIKIEDQENEHEGENKNDK